MPLATNPSKTLPVWLACDAEIPMAERPVFLVRFITRHEMHAHFDELEAVRDLTDTKEAHRRLDVLLARSVTGWRNMTQPGVGPVDYAPDRFDLILTVQEKWELAQLIPEAPRLTDEDKKKSSSPSPLTAESSASGASAGGAPKTTKPRKSTSRAKSSTDAHAK